MLNHSLRAAQSTKPKAPEYLAVGGQTSPYVAVYPWSTSGYGAKFSDPSSAIHNNVMGLAWSPAGNAIAFTVFTSPYLIAYRFSASGFGTKYTNPAVTLAGEPGLVAFAPNGTAIAATHQTSPCVSAYAWSSSGFGSKFSNPATLPSGSAGQGIAFSPDSSVLFMSTNGSPFVYAYAWSSSGFGTKYANPSVLPADVFRGMSVHPSGAAVAGIGYNGGGSSTVHVSTYEWSNATGWGARYADPTLGWETGYSRVQFSPRGDAIAVDGGEVRAWSNATGYGARLSLVSSVVGTQYDLSFAPDQSAITFSGGASPYTSAYAYSSSGVGTRFSNPATLPAGRGNATAFY